MAPVEERPTDLARTFAEVARVLLAADSVQEALQKIVDLAVETVEGCDHAGVSVVRGREVTTPAASDCIPPLLDAIQYETGEGPCLDAIRETEVYVADDLSKEERWPRFSRRAAEEAGVASAVAFRLFVQEDTLGALNFFSKRTGAFREDDVKATGSVFAAHAAIALVSARQQEHMERAVESRDVIGQAKGILMAQQHVTAEQAFDILRRASQRLNTKLVDVAARVAKTGEAPGSN